MSVETPFTRDNLDTYLKELAKEFRKLNGTAMPAEIVLIDGAAILAQYGFREKSVYKNIRENEKHSKEILLDFEMDYPNSLKEENISSILEKARQKRSVIDLI